MARPHDIDQVILIQAEAAFFSFWCWFRLCFLANFRFLRNLGSQPEKNGSSSTRAIGVVLPFMLICLLVEGFLIPPRWFFLVWNTFVEKKSHRQLTKNSPGYELCGSWTWPWRSWARDWSETRVCWATQVVFCHSIVTIACCTSLFGGTTSQLWQLQALTEGQG